MGKDMPIVFFFFIGTVTGGFASSGGAGGGPTPLLVEVDPAAGDLADDLVARLGGDEFLILLTDINDAFAAGAVARKLLKCLEDPIAFEEYEFYLSVSIGITIFPEDAENPDDLIKYADIAMYHAKEQGKNNYQFYSDAMNVDVLQRISLEAKLSAA